MSARKRWGIGMKRLFYTGFAMVCVLLWCETTEAFIFTIQQNAEWNEKLFIVKFYPSSIFSSLPKVEYDGQQYAIRDFVVYRDWKNKIFVTLVQGKTSKQISVPKRSNRDFAEEFANVFYEIACDSKEHHFNSYDALGEYYFEVFIRPMLLGLGIRFIPTGLGDRIANYWRRIAGAAALALGGLYLYQKYHKK